MGISDLSDAYTHRDLCSSNDLDHEIGMYMMCPMLGRISTGPECCGCMSLEHIYYTKNGLRLGQRA